MEQLATLQRLDVSVHAVRDEVAVEGEAEAVLLKPANLQEVLEPALSALAP